MNTGIYSIVNIVNHMNYVGSAIDLRERWKKHIKELNSNTHGSSKLQNAWNKYGEKNFTFMVREFVKDKSKLIEREQWWMDFLKSNNRELGYNIRLIAESCLGIKHSEETKQRMSLAKKGKTWSEDYKKKMSEVKKGLVKSPEWQAKITASLIARRDKNMWPHEKGSKCKCEECKLKKKLQHIERCKPLPYIMVDNNAHR